MAVDVKTLRELRNNSASMAKYYREKIGEKPVQNAAMVAAGLKPLHDERSLQWDADALAKQERYVEALDAVLAEAGADVAEAA